MVFLIIERDTKVTISLKSEVAENSSRLKTPAFTLYTVDDISAKMLVAVIKDALLRMNFICAVVF